MIRFGGICLVTEEVPPLVAFYRTVLQMEPEGYDAHAEFALERGGLAIFSLQGMEELSPGSMAKAGAGACVIMLQTEDCDLAYHRLTAAGAKVVEAPATFSRGARSAWFHDPDGNIIDVCCQMIEHCKSQVFEE